MPLAPSGGIPVFGSIVSFMSTAAVIATIATIATAAAIAYKATEKWTWANSVSIPYCQRKRRLAGRLIAAVHATICPPIGGSEFPEGTWQRKERNGQYGVPCWRAGGGVWDWRPSKMAARRAAARGAWRGLLGLPFKP